MDRSGLDGVLVRHSDKCTAKEWHPGRYSLQERLSQRNAGCCSIDHCAMALSRTL